MDDTQCEPYKRMGLNECAQYDVNTLAMTRSLITDKLDMR